MKVEITKQAYEKIKRKTPWLYKNELKVPECDAGSVAELIYRGEYCATAFINPKSKITARILSYEKVSVDREFFKQRIKTAIERRSIIGKNVTNSLRLVHSEADFLPGLIVDRYGDNVVTSFTTAGMDNFKGLIVEILIELLKPKGIYEKGDKIREKEGLEVLSHTLYGEVDNEFIINEHSKKFLTHLKDSQKTGFFLDQRKNRKAVSKFKAKRVLDLFSNAGGFGIYAGGEYTKFVEISALACSLIEKNCELNGMKNYDVVKADVFKFLEKENETYDMIIIDPPAFAKNKKARSGAIKGWKYLIVNSLKLLKKGGYMALFSCSHSITQKDLLDLALSSSIIDNSYLEVVEFLKQDVDHPYLLNVPNSLYLTGAVLRKL